MSRSGDHYLRGKCYFTLSVLFSLSLYIFIHLLPVHELLLPSSHAELSLIGVGRKSQIKARMYLLVPQEQDYSVVVDTEIWTSLVLKKCFFNLATAEMISSQLFSVLSC